MQATGHLTLPRSWVVPVASCKYGGSLPLEEDDDKWNNVKFAYDSPNATFCVVEDGHVVQRTRRYQGPPIVLAPSEDPLSVRLVLVRHGKHHLDAFWDIQFETPYHRQALLVHLLNMGSTIIQRPER